MLISQNIIESKKVNLNKEDFKITNENQPHKFILNGVTREPMIVFNVGKINFGPLLLGGRQKETIQMWR